MLNHECIADCLDVDCHRTSIVARSCAGSDVCARAALIFGVRKVEQPICDVHLLQGSVDNVSNGRDGECEVTGHMISLHVPN